MVFILSGRGLLLFCFLPDLLADEPEDNEGEKDDDADAQFVAVAVDEVCLPVGDITQEGKDDVPNERTEESIEQELPEVHLRQSGGNANQLADTRNEPPDKGADFTVVVEIVLRLLHRAWLPACRKGLSA